MLIKQALIDESDYYWSQVTDNPDFALPDTRNLTGYLAGHSEAIPGHLANLEPGFHDLPSEGDFSLAYVTDRNGHRLVMVFDGERVGTLVVWFGIIPLAAVLVILYLISLFAYRASRRAISPMVDLARRVDQLDPSSDEQADPFKVSDDADEDTRLLSDALSSYHHRLQSFVARERNFTRDASHELRSPLTVIRIAADMLLIEQELSRQAQNSVHRIKNAVEDMEQLTAAFLMLAREAETDLTSDPVSINEIVAEELDSVRIQIGDKPVSVAVEAECELVVEAPDRIVGAILGNIMRNAANYTDEGSLTIHIQPSGVTVSDTGVGIEAENLDQIFTPFNRAGRRRRGGHGVGLTIVKRISDRFEWPIQIDSEVGKGTVVTVRFSQADVRPLRSDDPS